MAYPNYKGSNPYFINPYNFVGVDFAEGQINKEKTEPHTGGISGVLRCELITKTPICIPDTASAVTEKNGHKQYDFMRTPDGYPMIPGSALRGPIRSVFETVTDSCLSTVDTEEIITYRTKTAFKPGLIYIDDKGKYHLYKAGRYIFRVEGNYAYTNKDGKTVYTYRAYSKEDNLFKISENELKKNYRYAEEVFILPLTDKKGNNKEFKTFINGKELATGAIFIKSLSKTESQGAKKGYMCIGEEFNKKHFESVFVLKDPDNPEEVISCEPAIKGKEKSILERAIDDLDQIIKVYNDDTININAKAKKEGGKKDKPKFYQDRNYKNLEKGKYYPIWYAVIFEGKDKQNEIKNVYLSVANIGRAAYNKNMGSKLGKYTACKSIKNACPACRLFGMAKKDSAAASRVRFSDAILYEKAEKSEKVLLKELSSPKTSYLPFYLKRKGENDKWSYDSDNYELRGRKYYWHNSGKNAYVDRTNKKTERNASVELIGTGQEKCFGFSLYFDNLSKDELDKLMWVLTLSENSKDSKQCHKIGHGKPIGLGSVKIVITGLEKRIFENGSYKVEITDNPEISKDLFDSKSNSISEVLEITRLDACKMVVDYPGIVDASGEKIYSNKNQTAAHQWFSSNFSLGREPEQPLPEIKKVHQKALNWKVLPQKKY